MSDVRRYREGMAWLFTIGPEHVQRLAAAFRWHAENERLKADGVPRMTRRVRIGGKPTP